jgi:hypothetical protein
VGRRAPARATLISAAKQLAGRPSASKLDPFKDEIHRLLRDDPKLPGQRIRELIEQLGFDGGKTLPGRSLPRPPILSFSESNPVSDYSARPGSVPARVGRREAEGFHRATCCVLVIGYRRGGADQCRGGRVAAARRQLF